MKATVNGIERDVAEGQLLAVLLGELGIASTEGIAVAVNERVVPRANIGERTLAAGDRVEIIRAVAGG